MDNPSFTVRTMKEEDIPVVLDLYKDEKWLDGQHNLYVWSQFDPEGFKVAEKDTGEIIGACFAVRQDKHQASVGGYVVRKEYRGKGIGKKIWAECLKHIKDRKATINGEDESWKMYYESGDFPIIEKEWHLLMLHTDDEIDSKNLSSFIPQGVSIHPFSEVDLEALCSYDSSLLGFDRKSVLQQLFQMPMTKTFVAYKKEICVGYGCIQPNIYNGSYIAPLYANDPIIAENLLKKLIDSSPSKFGLEVATSSTNKSCQELLKKLNCTFETVECVRLYRKEKYCANINSVYSCFLDYSTF